MNKYVILSQQEKKQNLQKMTSRLNIANSGCPNEFEKSERDIDIEMIDINKLKIT